MPTLSASDKRRLLQLAAARQERHGLPGHFYEDPLVYRADIESIWRTGWVFAGHSCQLPNAGDFLTFEIDADPLILLRGDDGEVRGFHNVCRHRGTLLCDAPQGTTRRLVCPYHQWTYGRHGELVSCRGMPNTIDKSQLGLTPVALAECGGLVFVCLSDSPPDFSPARDAMQSLLMPQGLERAKVAATAEYIVQANWKVVWENNRECYHCNANHPQYILANYDHYNADDTSPQIAANIQAAVRHSHQRWESAGLAVSHHRTGMATFPDADRNLWYAANRTVLADGYLSESMDGQMVGPLMGDYTEPDVGTLRVRTMPNMWNHSSCDHGVTTRLLPINAESTAVQVVWLVDQKAEEHRDYELDKLMPFWKLTSEQDWQLCERAQRGLRSSGYRPGPLSEFKEYNVDAFLRWYLLQFSNYLNSVTE